MKRLLAESLSNLITTTGGAVVGTSLGSSNIGAAVGALLNPVATSILMQVMGDRQKSRLEQVVTSARAQIEDSWIKQTPFRQDMTEEDFANLFEGALLKAKDTYEALKVSLLANLVARAPFTNTPIQDLLQTLIDLSSLSFRQICILSIVDQSHFPQPVIKLSNKSYKDEYHSDLKIGEQGTYEDILFLLNTGLLYQVEENLLIPIPTCFQIVPAQLELSYRGRLLCIGASLYKIDPEQLSPIIAALAAQ